MIDVIWSILCDAFFAALAALGFGAVSNPARRSLPYICLLAAVAHGLRYALMNYFDVDIVTGSLAGAFTAGMLSLWVGRRCHTPVSCLFIPALLPMVPGMYAYRSVFALIMFVQSADTTAQAHYLQLFETNFFVTIMVVTVMAAGATLPKFIFPGLSFSMTRHRNKN